jgi:predicted site-specific integrase-resolvase
MNNPIKRLFSKLLPAKSEKVFYSIADVASIFHIPERDIYDQNKQGKIRAIQINKGGNYRIPSEEINRLKNNRLQD